VLTRVPVTRHQPLADPALAARYEQETSALLASRLRVCCWLAILLVPVFVALDAILHPQLVRPFLVIRGVMIAFSALVLLALRGRSGRRHVASLSLAVFCETGLGIVVMTAFNGGGSSPYYAGVNLVMLAAAVLMPWDVGLSVGCAVALIGGYVVTAVRWGGIPSRGVFAANLFFLGSTAVIMAVSHLVAARGRRHEFLQRVALENAGRHRDEFLANVTHELRTPLAAILGFCEMLADYMPDATTEQRTWLARIADNATTLYRLIVQLLDFAKIEAGAMQLARERFTLDAIVTKVGDDMRAIAGNEGAAVAVEIAADPLPVVGDRGRVEEILSNLAANALKFSRNQPIVIRLGPGSIDGEPPWDRLVPDPGPEARGQRYAEVAVVDRGEGIRIEDLRRLFVAFRQLDGSSTRRHGGTGLGLAISARLAAAMHGYIAVHSVPGIGSTFALLLPLADPTDAVIDGEDVDVGPAALTGRALAAESA
jgi:signal transduction histidine kinase